MDTFIQVLNSGMKDLKDHLSTAATTPPVAPVQQQSVLPDDDYLRSLLDDFPDFGEAPPSALAPTPPRTAASPAVRYTAMKRLGAPPSSPPPFDSEDDEDSTPPPPPPMSTPLPLSQRVARKSMSSLATSSPDSSSSSTRHEQYLRQEPVSEVHRLLRRVFREHATGQRNTRNATHKILDIAHNIVKEHIQ